jgi:hypothetical protein
VKTVSASLLTFGQVCTKKCVTKFDDNSLYQLWSRSVLVRPDHKTCQDDKIHLHCHQIPPAKFTNDRSKWVREGDHIKKTVCVAKSSEQICKLFVTHTVEIKRKLSDLTRFSSKIPACKLQCRGRTITLFRVHLRIYTSLVVKSLRENFRCCSNQSIAIPPQETPNRADRELIMNTCPQ